MQQEMNTEEEVLRQWDLHSFIKVKKTNQITKEEESLSFYNQNRQKPNVGSKEQEIIKILPLSQPLEMMEENKITKSNDLVNVKMDGNIQQEKGILTEAKETIDERKNKIKEIYIYILKKHQLKIH